MDINQAVESEFWSDETVDANLVDNVKGVVNVIHNITNPNNWIWKADQEIREDVRDELFWSPFVDEDRVSITASNGVVILTGNVDNWSERKAAEDNAYEGGAENVINNLSVINRYYGPYYERPFYAP